MKTRFASILPRLRTWTARREAGLVLVLILLSAIMGRLSPYFWDLENLLDMARQYVEIGIMAVAMTLVILTGGIDLSVGSGLAMCGIILGYGCQYWGFPVPVAVGVTLAVGLASGFLNGLLITFARIPSLIVTLATWAAYGGVAMAISRAQPASEIPDAILYLGNGYPFGIPVQLFLLAVAALAGQWFLAKTVWGREIHAIGSNETAARFSGVPVERVKRIVYTLSGLSAAVAAVILTGRSSTAHPEAAKGYELTVIACVVLGGTRIQGGSGSVVGTMLGLAILAVLQKGLHLRGVTGEWQTILTGTVLILTALFNRWTGGGSQKIGRPRPTPASPPPSATRDASPPEAHPGPGPGETSR